MTTSVQEVGRNKKSDEAVRFDIVTSILICLSRDRGVDCFSVDQLHLRWRMIITFLDSQGIEVLWHQDPVSRRWPQLDQIIQELLLLRFLERVSAKKESVALTLGCADERRFIRGAEYVGLVIKKRADDLCLIYKRDSD